MFHLLLGRARESPAPKLLLVIPSKLDCLKLAKFFRLELKVYCVVLGWAQNVWTEWMFSNFTRYIGHSERMVN